MTERRLDRGAARTEDQAYSDGSRCPADAAALSGIHDLNKCPESEILGTPAATETADHVMSILALLATLTTAVTFSTELPRTGAESPARLFAQSQGATDPLSEPQDEVGNGDDARYQVYLLTLDQGDEVWERFGHNALLIRDRDTDQDMVWNWGLFDFTEVDFLPRFLRGTMRYSMGPAPLNPFLDAYAAANRTIYANEVLLTPEEAEELDAFVRWNYLPENRAYTYHYYLDNCSTRIRDALDLVLDGVLTDTFAHSPTPYSFRWHSRRLVQETAWIDQGLSFLLGMRGDLPRSEWEAMFVPMELMERLESMERPTAAGGSRPILGPREVLFQATRTPAPSEPPAFSFVWVVAGLAGAGAFILLAAASRGRRRWAAVGIAVGSFLWGAVSFGLGGLLVMAWFTDHGFIQWNLNLLYLNPLSLLTGVAAVIALWAGWAARVATGAAVTVGALSLLTAALQLTPWIGQGNAEVVALAVPMNLGVAWALATLSRERGAALKPEMGSAIARERKPVIAGEGL